jgi:hypothetical protein
MFESAQRLREQIEDLLEGIRSGAGGRYACLLEPTRVLFERVAPDWREAWTLRRLVQEHSAALFALPASMASGAPVEDVFADWLDDEFLLAVINGRVALLVACPQAEALKERVLPPLQALADRLFRYEPRYRLDPNGRGFFFGRPRLELVVIGSPPSGQEVE